MNLRISKIQVLLIAGVLSAALGCNRISDKPNIELIQDMMESPADKPQEYDDFFENHSAARVPPENTVPVGFKAYRYGNDFNKASAENKNPLAGQTSKDVLMTGQKYYETNCAVCHGFQGHGDGPVAAKMPLKPPPLLSAKVRGWTDGGIYHVITKGQGTMGPYASHIPQAYRWQVVNYIRQLQNSQTSEVK